MITDEQLQEWKALADKATPQEWQAVAAKDDVRIWTDEDSSAVIAIVPQDMPYFNTAGNVQSDAAFIAAARTAVPALIAEVERLKAELATVPVDTIRTIALTEAGRLDTIDWSPIATWFETMDGAA